MSQGLLDTSVLVADEHARSLRREDLPAQAFVSVITFAELRAGVLIAADLPTRSARLLTLERARAMQPLPIDDDIAESWAQLRVGLRERGRRMPVNDSWIAATALAHQLPVITQDDDYDDIPGLDVIKV